MVTQASVPMWPLLESGQCTPHTLGLIWEKGVSPWPSFTTSLLLESSSHTGQLPLPSSEALVNSDFLKKGLVYFYGPKIYGNN
jgi:hypothetical protein